MKKVSITVRIPIFIDVELEVDDQDYNQLLDEWDNSNFGVVKQLIDQYVDLNDIDVPELQERYGDSEIVDLKMERPEDIISSKTDEIECNTIAPKGRPN